MENWNSQTWQLLLYNVCGKGL